MESKYKKRNRIPSSCSVCRKRKSRCDRVRPVCGSCKRKSIAHLCFYENESQSDSRPIDDKAMEPPTGHAHIPQQRSPSGPGPIPPGLNSGSGSSPVGGPPMPGHIPQPHIPVNANAIPHTSPGNVAPGPTNTTGTSPYYYSGNIPSTEMFARTTPNGAPLNHSIAPPPNGPPMPGSIPMPHQIPPLNYYEENTNEEYYKTNGSQSASSVQLPPIKGPHDNTVIVSIGPNSSLAVNPDDQIEEFFANASFPLLLEGPYLQSHGFLTYVGLTKSDRFVKFFRKFAVELLRKGEISEFVPKKKRKKTSNASSPTSKKTKSNQSTPLNSGIPSVNSQGATSPEAKIPGDDTPGNGNHQRNSESGSSKPTDQETPSKSLEMDKRDLSSEAMSKESSKESKTTSISTPNKNDDLNGKSKDDVEADESSTTNDKDATIKQEEGKENIGEEDEDEEEEEDEDDYYEEDEEAGNGNKEVDDEEDILVITKINVAKEQKEKDRKNEKDYSLSILPGLKALYLGQSSRKEYYKIVEQAVLKVLPCKIGLLTLMTRYFKWVHPFIPIVNESTMIRDFNQVVDQFPQFKREKYTSLTIKSDKHLTILGMMLVIARLGYLSLIHNHSVNNRYGEEEGYILDECKTVPFKTFADVVNLCTPDEHTSLRSTFRMVQLLSLTYFYRQVAPNDCHGVGAADSQILFGSMVRHALSIGLNRDPQKYFEHETINSNKGLVESWRNLWNYLVINDASTAMYRSSILNIYSSDVADVEIPHMNLLDQEFKETYETIFEISKSYRKLVTIFSNFRKKPRVIDILAETNRLEHIFFNFFGKDFFKDFICKPANGDVDMESREHRKSYLKVIKYLTFILLRANLSSIYYVIAMNYERKYNEDKTTSISSGVELFKIHFKSVVQLVYIMSYVFDNSVELFGKNYDYILTAANERYMIKTHSFLTSFFIRLIHQKQLLTFKSFEPESGARLEAVNKLFNMILVEAELFVGNFRRLSLRYVNSYKIYVLTYYVLKQCMENAEVFFKYALSDPSMILDTTNMLQYFSVSEINYLCKLCEEFRFAKDSQERQRRANAMFSMTISNTNSADHDNSSHYSARGGGMNTNMEPGLKGPTAGPSSQRGSTTSEGVNPNVDTGSSLNSNTGYTDPISINQLNPMKDFDSNVFKMPNASGNNSEEASSSTGHGTHGAHGAHGLDDTGFNILNDLSDLHDPNFKSDDFIKLFELYGDTSNPHLE